MAGARPTTPGTIDARREVTGPTKKASSDLVAQDTNGRSRTRLGRARTRPKLSDYLDFGSTSSSAACLAMSPAPGHRRSRAARAARRPAPTPTAGWHDRPRAQGRHLPRLRPHRRTSTATTDPPAGHERHDRPSRSRAISRPRRDLHEREDPPQHADELPSFVGVELGELSRRTSRTNGGNPTKLAGNPRTVNTFLRASSSPYLLGKLAATVGPSTARPRSSTTPS